MKLDADLHNFGQKVAQVWRGSEIYFQKPRPIFWEWFFFGVNSPLKNIFNDYKFSDGIFNLHVEISENLTGMSKRVCEVDTIDTTSHTYHLGALLAYCYIFGIRDLHKGNVIKTKSHLQVIDAEVVLTKLLLPNETLLLPFRETPFTVSAAQKTFEKQEEINIEYLKNILSGYFDLFLSVIENIDKLKYEFEKQDILQNIPIRHIIRDTVQYRKYLESKTQPVIPFCSDELIQLERGDIPYYLKFIGDTTLYSYTTPNGDYSPVTEIPQDFIKGVERAAEDPLELLALPRLKENLLPTGALFLLKKLSSDEFIGSLKTNTFDAVFSTDSIKVHADNKAFSTKR